MGGFGSGMHNTWNAKTVVEDCCCLDLNWLTRDGVFDSDSKSTGVLSWHSTWRGATSSLSYRLQLAQCRIVLSYAYARESYEYALPLSRTTLPWGGHRYWLHCPLSTGQTPCYRRVIKLYRPVYNPWFGCRQCHNLTYRSCQESHSLDRVGHRCTNPIDGERLYRAGQWLLQSLKTDRADEHWYQKSRQRRARRKANRWS